MRLIADGNGISPSETFFEPFEVLKMGWPNCMFEVAVAYSLSIASDAIYFLTWSPDILMLLSDVLIGPNILLYSGYFS